MNVKSLLIAGGSMLVTMIVLTNWMVSDMRSQQAARGGSEAAMGQAMGADGMPMAEGSMPAQAGASTAGGMVATAPLESAQQAATACLVETGSFGACTSMLPAEVQVRDAGPEHLLLAMGSSQGDYLLRMTRDGGCRYASWDSSSCAVW